MLEDGSYDAIVFDAERADDGGTTVELTILAGDRKGEVVSMHTPASSRDPLDLLGVPATITVSDGTPTLRLEG